MSGKVAVLDANAVDLSTNIGFHSRSIGIDYSTATQLERLIVQGIALLHEHFVIIKPLSLNNCHLV